MALVILGGLLSSTTAAADTMYVTDILRLGLHSASDTSDSPFRTLVSGDELEILQRTTYYARVRTTDGAEGWVKASYLIDEKPAQAKLTELARDRASLAAELATVNARMGAQESELQSLRTKRDKLERNAATVATEMATLRADKDVLDEQVAAYRHSVPFLWFLSIAGLTLVGGFLGGWWYADAKQRKRHGGFRI